jgi:ankyrin repeat protein
MLSRLSPSTRVPESASVWEVADDVENHLNCKESFAVVLCGNHGTGKSTLAYQVYKSLLLRRGSSEWIIYFAFDAQDNRRQSVSAMLIMLIRQLLACEPDLLPSIQEIMSDDDDDDDDAETRWTEGNLWIQLRFIARETKRKSIKVVIDSLTDCDTEHMQTFLRTLLDLRFAAPGRLKLICTADTSIQIPTTDAVRRVDIHSLSQFKDNWAALKGRLADSLASDSPKLDATKTKVKECLEKSKGFLHSILIAYRIRSITSFSRPTCVELDLAKLGIGMEQTIMDMMSSAPSWVATAVSWMLFVQRPLRPTELAVAVALEDWLKLPELVSKFDERLIPRDIQGDLRRQLGPLVTMERGEMRISHPYVGKVIQGWLEPKEDRAMLRKVELTKLLVGYLKICLEKIKTGNRKDIPDELSFGLLGYTLNYWHVHYRTAMDNVESLGPHSTATWLQNQALSLFRTTEYLRWLRPANSSGLEPRTYEQEGADALNALLLLATQFGLLDIVTNLMGEDEQFIQVAALQIACRYGHRNIVKQLVDGIDKVEDIRFELTRACKRGDEEIVLIMLDRYREVSESADIPPYLLPQVCRIGHTALAERLIDAGATVSEGADTLPLHEAVDQGNSDMVDLLLRKNADRMALFPDKSTPLLRSIQRGYSHISRRLLEEPGLRDPPNDDGVTAVRLAAGMGDVGLLEEVLKLHSPEDSEIRGGKPEVTKHNSPLHEAAANGHLGAVKTLLKHKYPINETDSKGRSALFLALSKDHRDVVNHLFLEGAKMSPGKVYEESALKQAVIHGNLSATRELLKDNPNPESYAGVDGSPLTDAARKNYAEIARLLLNANADLATMVNHEPDEEILGEWTDGGWIAVHFAAYYGSDNVMGVFLYDRGDLAGSPIKSGHTPLHLAVFKEQTETVSVMLPGAKVAAAAIDTTSDPKTPGAVKERKESITRAPATTGSGALQSGSERLVPLSFDVDTMTDKGVTALHIAIANGNLDLVKMLLVSGASPNIADKAGRTTIHFAATAHKDAADMLRLLLKFVNAGRPDVDGKTPLHYAAAGPDGTVVLQLLRAGGSPNAATRNGQTPLYLAAQAGNVNIVRHLVEHGADVDARVGNEGETALHVAAFGGHVDTTELLLKAGADVNAIDIRCDTTLHEAVRRGQVKVVHLLLEAGAKVDAQNARRITPLQRAVLNQWTETAKTLLEAGADPDIRDEDGDTALTAAMYSDQLDMVLLLLGSGADLNVLNGGDNTPLMLALQSPKLYLPPLIEAGADVRLCGGNGITVLHKAAAETSMGAVDNVLPLLQHGKGHLDIRDAEGLAPVHHAAKAGRVKMIQKFHECGADLSAKDNQGRTAMHHAVRSWSLTDFVQVFANFLLPNEKNKVHIPDVDGWTPLHWACKYGRTDVASQLLAKCETDEDRRNMILHKGEHGWTALAVAEFHDRTPIIRALRLTLIPRSTLMKANDDGAELRTATGPDNSTETSEVKPEDTRPVERGIGNPYFSCDDCLDDVSSLPVSFIVHMDLAPSHVR